MNHKPPAKRVAGRNAVRLGWVLSAIGGLLYAGGLMSPLEDFGNDLHAKYFASIDADPRIVLIDIDDQTLRTGPEWPWHRRVYADIVGVLHELGASMIGLDLVFDQPRSPRPDRGGLSPHYDVDPGPAEVGDVGAAPLIYDDDELRDAIRTAGHVHLAMFADVLSPDADPVALRQHVRSMVGEDEATPLDVMERRIAAEAQHSAHGRPSGESLDRAVVAAHLERDYSLNVTQLENRIAGDDATIRQRIRNVFARAKRDAARFVAGQYLHERGQPSWSGFRRSILPNVPTNSQTADSDELIMAYRFATAWSTILEASPLLPPESVDGRGLLPVAHAFEPTIPVDKLTDASRGVGFVSYDRRSQGQALRSVPLVLRVGDRLLLHLGLQMACDAAGIEPRVASVAPRALTIGGGRSRIEIPLNRSGETIIHWHSPDSPGDWRNSFTHIPMARILEIVDNRRLIEANTKRLRWAIAELVKFRHRETPAEYEHYVRMVNRALAISRQRATGWDAGNEGPDASETNDAIERIEDDALVWLRRIRRLWNQAEPVDDAERAQRDAIERFHERLGDGRLAQQVENSNSTLRERVNDGIGELRPIIQGKYCLVGYTASAEADMVATPVHNSMPGVMVHANLLNMLLERRFVFAVPTAACLAGLVLATGLLGVLAGRLSPVGGFACMLAAIGAVLGLGAALFRFGSAQMASFPIALWLFVVWAGVTAFRRVTEERSRRVLRRALSQYTSSAVAERIGDRLDRADLLPAEATVTCFFSDLHGFTRMSERLGPARTRAILDPYLNLMSETLVAHGAMVNKFIGDGVFAFFNAPILECRNHETAACRSALAALAEIEALDPQAANGGMRSLRVRIGLATGRAFVGDYGGHMKLDYTCIGDTVNVASRIEQANKAFGTTVLVNEQTAGAAVARPGEGLRFRSLGLIELPGRDEPVLLRELVAAGSAIFLVDGYIERFETAVGKFQAGEWDTCLSMLNACREDQPGDRAVELYARAVELFRAHELSHCPRSLPLARVSALLDRAG